MREFNNKYFIKIRKTDCFININDKNSNFYENDDLFILFEGILSNTKKFLSESNLINSFNFAKKIKIILEKNKLKEFIVAAEGNWNLIICYKKIKRIHAIRDRYGSYPLFYINNNDDLIFTNSINLLQKEKLLKLDKDITTISRFIGYGELHTTKRTFFLNFLELLLVTY